MHVDIYLTALYLQMKKQNGIKGTNFSTSDKKVPVVYKLGYSESPGKQTYVQSKWRSKYTDFNRMISIIENNPI